MKVGSQEWFKRERDWLYEDIEDQLKLIETYEEKGAFLLAGYEHDNLARMRKELKLLRENPQAYERKIRKEILSRLPVRN